VIRRVALAVSAYPRLRWVLVRTLDRLPNVKRRLKDALARDAAGVDSREPRVDASLLSIEARRVLADLFRARDTVAREPVQRSDYS